MSRDWRFAEESRLFALGFMASHTSRILSIFSKSGKMPTPDEVRHPLYFILRASAWLNLCMGSMGSKKRLQILYSDFPALEEELANKVSQVQPQEYPRFLSQLRQTLTKLANSEEPSREEVERAHKFFNALADLLLEKVQTASHSCCGDC